MKNLNLLLLISFLSIVSFMSCNKKEEIINVKKEYSAQTVKDIISIQNKFEYSSHLVEKAKDYNKGNHFVFRDDCPDVSASNSFGHFPNTITIDFGAGCEVNDSLLVSGKILVTFYGFMNHSGDSLTTVYQNFSINGNEISGIYVVKNLGKDNEGFRNILKELRNGHIALISGENASYQFSRTVRYSINNTPFNSDDDEFRVTGDFSGVDIHGDGYTGHVKTELVMPVDCGCFVSGEQEITINNEDVYKLNFGDGTCDHTATLTLPDGTTEDIEVCNH